MVILKIFLIFYFEFIVLYNYLSEIKPEKSIKII